MDKHYTPRCSACVNALNKLQNLINLTKCKLHSKESIYLTLHTEKMLLSILTPVFATGVAPYS